MLGQGRGGLGSRPRHLACPRGLNAVLSSSGVASLPVYGKGASLVTPAPCSGRVLVVEDMEKVSLLGHLAHSVLCLSVFRTSGSISSPRSPLKDTL